MTPHALLSPAEHLAYHRNATKRSLAKSRKAKREALLTDAQKRVMGWIRKMKGKPDHG